MKVTPPSDQLRSHLTLKKIRCLRGPLTPTKSGVIFSCPFPGEVYPRGTVWWSNSWFSEQESGVSFCFLFEQKYCTVFWRGTWKFDTSSLGRSWKKIQETEALWAGSKFPSLPKKGPSENWDQGKVRRRGVFLGTDTEGRNCCLWSVGLYYVSERK